MFSSQFCGNLLSALVLGTWMVLGTCMVAVSASIFVSSRVSTYTVIWCKTEVVCTHVPHCSLSSMQPYLGKTWALEESSAALLISEINMVSALYRTVRFTLCMFMYYTTGCESCYGCSCFPIAFALYIPHRVVDTFILLRLRFTKSKLFKLTNYFCLGVCFYLCRCF